jgi:CTP:molybdopterin cytidylyltransferase MocA
MRLHGIVLAAGSGRRMGLPKALLRLGGRTLLERHVLRLHESGVVDVLAVVRPDDADEARATLRQLPFEVTLVSATTPSQAASLVVAARHLPIGPGDIVAVTPVDLMPPRPETIVTLASTLVHTLAATPSYRGRGGHPALLRAAVIAPYLRGETPPLRDVLAALGRDRLRVEVDDAAVVGDFDQPSDLPLDEASSLAS